MEYMEIPAVEYQQTGGRKLYGFAVDVKHISKFADTNRIGRNEQGELVGYQRPEIRRHIQEIARYLESPASMLPNAVVVAFERVLEFRPSSKTAQQGESHPRLGILRIPCFGGDGALGRIIDGQQRVSAFRVAKLEAFQVMVTAFVALSLEEQRAQFVLVNSAKQLPHGLVLELLPGISEDISGKWRGKRHAAVLMSRLNCDPASPFRGLIKTQTNPSGVVRDNSVIRMISNSLSDGALYHNTDSLGIVREDDAVEELLQFWDAVRDTFPEAWGVSSRKSRLMHGVGIVSMGYLMDAIYYQRLEDAGSEIRKYKAELSSIKHRFSWTSGHWDLGAGCRRRWDEFQNTSHDVQVLTNHILSAYRMLLRS